MQDQLPHNQKSSYLAAILVVREMMGDRKKWKPVEETPGLLKFDLALSDMPFKQPLPLFNVGFVAEVIARAAGCTSFKVKEVQGAMRLTASPGDVDLFIKKCMDDNDFHPFEAGRARPKS